jgi:type IV secretion system protein VirB10
MDQVSNNDSGSNSNATTVQDEMAAALAAQLGQTTLQLLQKNLNIKPTLEIRPGYQFNIIVTRDVVFRGAYGN